MANLNDATEGLFLISEGVSFHIEQQKKRKKSLIQLFVLLLLIEGLNI